MRDDRSSVNMLPRFTDATSWKHSPSLHQNLLLVSASTVSARAEIYEHGKGSERGDCARVRISRVNQSQFQDTLPSSVAFVPSQ
jgi:hypothetical protein